MFAGQFKDRLGPPAAEQLDRRPPSKPFGRMQEPEGRSDRREGELLEDFFETGDDASRGIGLELPEWISPLRADTQGEEASGPAQSLERLTRPSDPASGIGHAYALAEDAFARGQGLHLTECDALGGSGHVERLVYEGKGIESELHTHQLSRSERRMQPATDYPIYRLSQGRTLPSAIS